MRKAKARVEKHESDIARETAKQNSDSQAKRAHVQKELDELKGSLEQKKEHRKACEEKLNMLHGQKRDLDDEYDEAKRNYDRHLRSMQEAKKKIESLRLQRQDKLTAFGKSVPHLLQDIEREQRWQHKPVGPLGRYLKLRKPEFSDVIEMVLNQLMNAYIVENFHDQKLLKALLKKHRMYVIIPLLYPCHTNTSLYRDWNTTVIVAKHDIFDYSASEPDERYITMLRVLEV